MHYKVCEMKVSDIAKAVGGQVVGNGDLTIKAVSADSRDIPDKCVFIPICGEIFDGHDFISSAFENGARGCFSHKEITLPNGKFAVMVKDTKKALLDLAQYYRSLFDIQVIALTGSVGKTTTKNLVCSVLEESFKTLKTKGNFNNEIGVPYTIFGLEKHHEKAVIEMGMSNFGEIERLSKCARPDICIITNIGTSHMEYLGSRQGILKAKTEIFCGMNPAGVVILNGDDEYLYSIKDSLSHDAIYFGINNPKCDILAYNVVSDETGVSFEVDDERYQLNVLGEHNVYNALAAIAAARYLGMKTDDIKNGISKYQSDGIRQNIIKTGKYTVVNDCYNASPQSMQAAINILKTVSKGKRSIAVLGDMGELGENSPRYHYDVGEYAANNGVDFVVAVGQYAQNIADGAMSYGIKPSQIKIFENTDEAILFLDKFLLCEDAILIKASRFMKFEKIAEHILQ